MRRRFFRLLLSSCVVFLLLRSSDCVALAQSPENPAATLKAVHVEGVKHLSEAQVITLSGLTAGSAVGKTELQAAADRLVQTGLFSNVNYAFQSKEEGLYLTF